MKCSQEGQRKFTVRTGLRINGHMVGYGVTREHKMSRTFPA